MHPHCVELTKKEGGSTSLTTLKALQPNTLIYV